jgi:hypothetical protein
VPLAIVLWPKAEVRSNTKEAAIRRNRTSNQEVRDLLHRVCRRLPTDCEPYGRRFRQGVCGRASKSGRI